jgi:hypothetical protein
MCWSGEASTVLATVGLGSTAYAAYKKEPTVLWITLGYFSLMEALQAYTYSVIDNCDSPANQISTLFGYLHIAFQPFFINAISLYFVPEKTRKMFFVPSMVLCFVASIMMLVQLYPFEWAGQCHASRPLCGDILCSVSGNWHIAWKVPTNGIGNFFVDKGIFGMFATGFIPYEIAGFVLPLLYGSWRFTLYHYLMGPWLAERLTNNINEWPAVWCLLSIGLLLIVVKTPVRKILHVKKWYFWKF